MSGSAALADAYATAIGNIIVNHNDLDKGLEFANRQNDLRGCLLIMGDKMGAVGNIEICKLS